MLTSAFVYPRPDKNCQISRMVLVQVVRAWTGNVFYHHHQNMGKQFRRSDIQPTLAFETGFDAEKSFL